MFYLLPGLGAWAPAPPAAGTPAWQAEWAPPTVRTHIGPLRHVSVVGLVQELGGVVVNVLDLDDELGRRLQRSVGVPVHRLSHQRVLGSLLSVQGLGGMNVP